MAFEMLSGIFNVEPQTQRAPDESVTSDDLVAKRKLVRKIDLRLLSIIFILCSLTQLDSGLISMLGVSDFFGYLKLYKGYRYSIVILVYTISSVAFQIPAMHLLRITGPRVMFTLITIGSGVLTISSAFVKKWWQLVGIRILLGMVQSSLLPGLGLLISSWYTKQEQAFRIVFLQCGTVFFLGFGNFLNCGLNNLDGFRELSDWQWIVLGNGLIAIVLGPVTYFWMVQLPEEAHNSFRFLTKPEQVFAVERIQKDLGDVESEKFSWTEFLSHFIDLKLYAFSLLWFNLSLVKIVITYFTDIFLSYENNLSFNRIIILSAPPYIYSVLPLLISSYVGDFIQRRGSVIIINSACSMASLIMLGFGPNWAIQYAGIIFATGAVFSNLEAISAFQNSNISGHWKRATYAVVTTIFSALGEIAGTFIVDVDDPSNDSSIYYSKVKAALKFAVKSHIIMTFIVAIIIYFMYHANKKQKKEVD